MGQSGALRGAQGSPEEPGDPPSCPQPCGGAQGPAGAICPRNSSRLRSVGGCCKNNFGDPCSSDRAFLAICASSPCLPGILGERHLPGFHCDSPLSGENISPAMRRLQSRNANTPKGRNARSPLLYQRTKCACDVSLIHETHRVGTELRSRSEGEGRSETSRVAPGPGRAPHEGPGRPSGAAPTGPGSRYFPRLPSEDGFTFNGILGLKTKA